MNALHASCGVVLFVSALTAQQAIATVFGTTVGGQTGYTVAPAGDMDGDNVPDFLVSSPFVGNGLLQIISGATRTARNINNPNPGGWATTTVISTEDMNLDGVRDLVIERGPDLLAYSGATATLLWQTTGITFRRAASIGDIDNDGRGDLAVVVYNGNEHLRTLRGSNGTLMLPSWQLVGNTLSLISIGDIDGDGHAEVANTHGGNIEIFSVSPMNFLRAMLPPCTAIAAANMAGDGRNEVIGIDGNFLHIYSATAGTLLQTFQTAGSGGSFTVLGDLDADGIPDLARALTLSTGATAVDMISGRTGTALGRWLDSARLRCNHLAGIGDVNGDGYGDLLIGDEQASSNGPAGPTTGGWQLVSGRILASMNSIPVQCAQGPWFPQLGMTRPVIGQTTTIEGRDCPPGTFGVLALSQQPALPTNFGVAGCDAWWDVGNWVMLHNPNGTAWQFSVSIPNVPQFAGLGIALQAFYLPTATPIGFDLSNAVWARIGW